MQYAKLKGCTKIREVVTLTSDRVILNMGGYRYPWRYEEIEFINTNKKHSTNKVNMRKLGVGIEVTSK